MIPGVMVDFLARASVAVAGTRDRKLVPHAHFLSGWFVEEDRRSVVCLLSEAFAEGLVDRLAHDGDIAMAAEVIGPHECYQFKGRYLDSRPASSADHMVFEACRRRFVESVQRLMGDRFDERTLNARFREPTLAVRFEVREIYVQTPGPAAGRRLFPPEAS